MGAAELLATLRAQGFSVEARGGALAVRPAGGLSPELRAELAARKAALLVLLADPAPAAACRHCGLRLWWRRPVDGGWVCGLCHPDPEALAGERSRPGPAVGEGGR